VRGVRLARRRSAGVADAAADHFLAPPRHTPCRRPCTPRGRSGRHGSKRRRQGRDNHWLLRWRCDASVLGCLAAGCGCGRSSWAAGAQKIS
jgi:hypothetical protein